MLEKLRIIRIAVSLVLLGGGLSVGPAASKAVAEEPCEFGGIFTCTPDMAHRYGTSCEGIDCYSGMEFCCPFPE